MPDISLRFQCTICFPFVDGISFFTDQFASFQQILRQRTHIFRAQGAAFSTLPRFGVFRVAFVPHARKERKR